MNSFKEKKDLKKKKLPARKCLSGSTKDGKIGDDDKKSDTPISFKDYWTCENIWDKFDIKDMGDYHDRYLKKDVLLLADVFETFLDTCLKFYRLDLYFSSPRLSWDAILKMTRMELEKISDIDKYLFIEKELRGGISYIANRYAKANNKYMNDYDSEKLSKFITHLDLNNLYGWGLSTYLPYGGFKWLKNVDGFDVNSVSEKSPIGYFLEVDLEYPDELH